MQYILLIMLAYPSGDVKINDENPPVFYAKKACTDAQDFIRVSTPSNATVTISTMCAKRGSNRE